MGMLDGYTPALNAHLEREAKREIQWDLFEGSVGHQHMKAHRLETLLANPVTLWEALGPDAIKYPFNDNMMGKSEIERAEIRRRMNDFQNHLAMQLTMLILAKDDAELGRILREMAEQYLKPQIDEWVDDNWRDWA
ncbi:MAG: hypothetical protein EP324_08180 [Gammaproteobacteria bacterium]|nr:MAG: hypothetical protein EP324_08180 [Gammaproteobacteria bacterium]